MLREPIGRLDADPNLRQRILPLCRLKAGEIWADAERGHRVGCLDVTNVQHLSRLCAGERVPLLIADPPYNLALAQKNTQNLFQVALPRYMEFSRAWMRNAIAVLADNAHFYVWIGADQNAGFQPLPDLMLLLREFKELTARSLITMRNQRGYGTQKNWMSVRQELLYYVKGRPDFTVVYTDTPKKVQGYYKIVGGVRTENRERSRSANLRPGNVWVDIQQVFYRMEENVPGAYAQKPLKAVERIVKSSSKPGQTILDLFSHSGTALLAGERLDRRVLCAELDPVFAELCIRRLEHWRLSGKTGFQCEHPFPEIAAPG